MSSPVVPDTELNRYIRKCDRQLSIAIIATVPLALGIAYLNNRSNAEETMQRNHIADEWDGNADLVCELDTSSSSKFEIVLPARQMNDEQQKAARQGIRLGACVPK